MSITLYKSNTLNSACEGVIDALGKNNTPQSRHIFIAPDKFSLSIEKEIFERLNIGAAFNIDVVSFMRLAIKSLGANAGDCLSKEGALLVFKKVLNRNADRLTHYARVARMPNFASEMYAVITSFRNNCYSPEDIVQAADNLSKNTKKKALDIALLYKEYTNELENGYPDSTTRIDKFIATAEFSDYIKGADIYIGGFSTFSAKQYQIITALMRSARSVNIGLTPDNGGKNSFLYPFYSLQRLKDIAEAEGLEYTEIDYFEVLQQPFMAINRGLFAVSGAEKAESENKFVLFKENTVYDEINGIAKEILSLVFEGGLRYKDIAVVCCNGSYDALIKSLFDRYNIPCFIDKKYRLKDALIVKHLMSALDAVEFGLKQDKVISYTKNPLCGIKAAEADSFENYVLERCTSYAGFLSPFKGEENKIAESVRSKITVDLSVFGTRKQTGGDFARACKQFISRAEIASILANETALTDDAMITASNMQSFDKLTLLLDEIENLIGEEEYSFGECKNILASCIEGGEFSLIPQYADSVLVGNIKDGIYDKLKVLFVMGATGDVLPSTHNYQAIISAKDSVMMEDSGLRLYPSPPDLIKEDMFALLELFTKATMRIYFGYSSLTPSGQQTRPSPVIAELKDITGAKAISLAEKHSILNSSADTLAKCAATERNAFFEFLQLYPKATQSGDKVSQKLDILYSSLSQELRDKIDSMIFAPKPSDKPDGRLYFNKDASGRYLTKATQLETYFKCPYLHHLQQGLKLNPRKDGKLQRNNAGIVIHRVLELFFERTKGVLRDMSQTELQTVSTKIIDEVFSDTKIVGESSNLFTRNSLESIRKECNKLTLTLAEKVKQSAYTPKLIEHSFGNNDEIIISTDSGDNFVMRGKIDRVDTLQEGETKKAIVIDYKTGAKNTSDAFFGNSLQLWMYLKALSHDGYQSAGAFYLPITDSPGKDDKPFLLSGYFDAAELGNLDTGIYSATGDGKTVYSSTLNASVKNGEIKTKTALDKKTLDGIIDYNMQIARMALEEILEGNIEKSPQDQGCERCGCYLVCGGAVIEACRKISKGKLPYSDCEEEVPDDQVD